MSEHTAFLRLAATAVDFPLGPSDARALAQHLQGCDRCRPAAESLRADELGHEEVRRPRARVRLTLDRHDATKVTSAHLR